MFDWDKWIEIGHVLSKNKLRTFLTGLGVFTGVFILIILLASSTGLKNGILGEFGEVSKNSFFVWGGKTTMAYKGFNPGRTVTPLFSDATLLKNEIDKIKVAYPRCGGTFEGTKIASRNGLSEGFTLRGDLPGVYEIEPVYLVKGRFINNYDIKAKRKVAVIGQHVYKVLFKDNENPIGAYIELNGTHFQVVGLMDTYSSGSQSEQDDQTIYIPITTYQNLYKTGETVSYLFVNVKDKYLSKNVLEESFTLLKKKHHIHPEDKIVFGSFDLGYEFGKISNLFVAIQLLMWIVGIGTLISGVIGVSNIMLIVVKERTQEFGVMRAIGASPFVVISQVVLESGVLTTIFGIIGFIVGVGMVESGLLEMFFVNPESDVVFFKKPRIDFLTSVTSLLLIIVFGALSGLIPARRAVKIKPVEALKSE